MEVLKIPATKTAWVWQTWETLFKTIAELVIVYHKKKKFSGHLLRKLRFFPDLKVKHPFDPIENVT